MKEPKTVMYRLCLWAGIGLFVAAAVVLAAWQWKVSVSEQKAESYVRTIRALIPEPQGAVPEEKRDNTMPVLSLEGGDFAGILEIPRYGSVLPVCADWGESSFCPCRFSGSVYDRTLRIGGTSQKGQYDFYREISVGDAVCYTDMEGNRFSYTVTAIRHESHADQAAFQREEAGLILFIKNIHAFEYIMVYCDAPQ